MSAGVVAEGSVDQALRGKHYRGAIRYIMLLREALIHSRLGDIIQVKGVSDQMETLMETLRSRSTESKERVKTAHETLEDDRDLLEIVSKVYEANETDMGDCWLSFWK